MGEPHTARKAELLAPAGSMEALRAAVANGADAVYLGMQRFGARAYSSNFAEAGVREAVAYCHMRDVRVYATVNTIVFQDELDEVRRQLDFLDSAGVDGVIAQDLAVLTYVADNFPDMEAHVSTQAGIDDLEGALLSRELGARRVVLAREVPVEEVKRIRREAGIPVEVFVHGALCVSYSGNCIMSGMTGNRLGNRGRCIGSCRKLYDVVDTTGAEAKTGAADKAEASAADKAEAGAADRSGQNGLDAKAGAADKAKAGSADKAQASAADKAEGRRAAQRPETAVAAPDGSGTLLGRNYILSTRDLCTIDYVDELDGIDSLKIEGRMKEPTYVANVVSRYRMALDGHATTADKELLNRSFNRTFTRGYLMHEDRRDITNTEKPNHYGYEIGRVVGRVGGGKMGKAATQRTEAATFAGGRKASRRGNHQTRKPRPGSAGKGDDRGFRHTPSDRVRGMYEFALTRPLRQNDVIRIRHDGEDVNLSAAKIYDAAGRLINGADTTCYLRIREQLSPGDAVFVTKDLAYEHELESMLDGEYRHFPLDFAVHAAPGAPLVVDATCDGLTCTYTGDEPLSEALRKPTTLEVVTRQLARLGDTIFTLGAVVYEDEGAFVPTSMLNDARKDLVAQMCAARAARRPSRNAPSARATQDKSCAYGASSLPGRGPALPGEAPHDAGPFQPGSADHHEHVVPRRRTTLSCESTPLEAHRTGAHAASAATFPLLTAQVATQAQYDAAIAAGVETVWWKNVVPRNHNYNHLQDGYQGRTGELLIGGLGGVERYRATNPFVTDYSLNVVNAESIHLLHALGAHRVTLSYELNEHQLRDLVAAYRAQYGADPALEMVVYGRAPLLVTRYCPLKKIGQCGTCRTHTYEIRDEYGAFPLQAHEDCTTTVLNGRVLNLLDELARIADMGVEAFRLNFTTETPDQVTRVIATARAALAGTLGRPAFNPDTDTRGHFHKEIM